DDRSYQGRMAWHRHEDKCNGKCKTAKPRFVACAPDQQERQRHHCGSVSPGDQSPFRVRNFKQANREQQKKCRNREQCSDRLTLSDFGSRPVLPAEPEQIQSEKRNEPAEVVLLVDRPFAAELFAKSKPQRGYKQ